MILATSILHHIIVTIGGLFFFNRKKSKEKEDEIENEENTLLCRFVTDNAGRKIGESVSLNNDMIIIKSGRRFLGVPLKHIEDDGKTILVKGVINFDKAYELGEKWRKQSFRELKDESEGKEDGF
ncbi:MAG: hypothetical protein JSW60_06140 [Thermoplasmatales archaeon]|nr:MAG: hypothetical protein JSW60_06140 [Thermoplasmatales archaeon]